MLACHFLLKRNHSFTAGYKYVFYKLVFSRCSSGRTFLTPERRQAWRGPSCTNPSVLSRATFLRNYCCMIPFVREYLASESERRMQMHVKPKLHSTRACRYAERTQLSTPSRHRMNLTQGYSAFPFKRVEELRLHFPKLDSGRL